MSTTAITTPKSVAERVSERIRATYVELIAEDEWQQMVEKELQWFLTTPYSGHYSGQNQNQAVAPVRQLIRNEMELRFKEMIKLELDKPEYKETWEGNGYKGGAAIQQITKELTPDLVQSLFQGVITSMLAQMRNMMQQNRII